jgi:hypothetical protein
MFSLIITIVAVVLVAVLALATVYFGGSAFREGHAQATAATLVNESQQLRAAFDVYLAQQGSLPTGTSDQISAQLVASQTLKALPTANWTFESGSAVVKGLPDSVCIAMNKKLGYNSETVPSCVEVDGNNGYCCAE